MVNIPEELARSIQAGDCVLWAGAGFGSLAGRPGWEKLLSQLVPQCAEDARSSLNELLEQGRLRTVLSYVHRHHGDEPLAKLLSEVSGEKPSLEDGASELAELPWRACFSTAYDDVARAIFGTDGKEPPVLSHNTVHYLSLRDQADFFILKTPPTGRAMRADSVLFDLVEEVVRSRTILFVGFEPDDPDFVQILDLIDRIGRGNTHFAVLPFVSEPESEEWRERFGIEVLHVEEKTPLLDTVAAIRKATESVSVRPSDVDGALAVLDLTRAVRGLALRADLARDAALVLDADGVQGLVDALPGQTYAAVPAATLLRTGSVMLAHGRVDAARKCFQYVTSSGVEGELLALARFNLALTALAEGDRAAALDGLASLSDRSLAMVPPRFEITELIGRVGTQTLLGCTDRETKESIHIGVSTLGRPVGQGEQARFSAEVQKLVAIEHSAVCKVRGGFADGRLFGVMYDEAPGFILADTLDGPLPFDKAAELVLPLIDGLRACHAEGVLHRNINPQTILVGSESAMLRGFGFPPVVGFMRPSVQEENHGFLAPEIHNTQEANEASDTYSLGALLYHLLVGHPPQGGVPLPSKIAEVDPRVDALIEECLCADPAERISLGNLREKLEHINSTPDVGEAQRLVGTSAEHGHEEVVDLGRPRPVGGEPSAPVRITAPEDPNDLEAWAWILERKPTHVEAHENVERIESESREQQRWDRVVEVLGVKAQHAQRQQDRVSHLREMIELFENKLGAPRNAFESLQALVEDVDVEEQIRLLDELTRLAEVTGQWSALAESLVVVARRAPEINDQARLQTELGDVYAKKMGADDQALVAYEKAIELEATVERLQRAIALHRKQGSDAELVGALVSLADLQEGAPRHEALISAGKVLREQLGDEEGAMGCIEIVLSENGEHPDGLYAAESLARALERWDTLYDVLNKRAELTADPAEAAAFRREAVEVAREHRQDTGATIEQLTALTQADRGDKDAASELAEILRSRVSEEPAHRPTLIDALGILVDLAESPEDKARLLGEMASQLDQLTDGRERATDCREQILDALPVDHEHAKEAASALETVYRRQEAFTTLESMLLKQAESTDADEEFRARAWEKILELRKGPLGNEAGTVDALEALTTLESDDKRWRDALLELYLQREEFQKAGPLIRAQVFDEDDPKRKAELLLRGGLLREQIGKSQGAVEALEEAVALDPTLIKAWEALHQIYQENEQPLKAAEALVAAAEHNTNRAEKVRGLHEAGRRFDEDLDRPERAIDLYEQVVELDPDHRDAMTALLDRLVGRGALEQAWPHAQIYVMQVRSQAANDHKLNLRALSLAGRCALAVDEKDKAREYLEKAKALDATNLDVLALLADLDMEAERWSEALRNYQSVVLGAGDKMPAGEMSRLYVNMAKARVGMGENAKSIQMLERALDIDADNEGAVEMLIEVGSDVGGAAATVKAKKRLVELLDRRAERAGNDEERGELRDRQVAVLTEIADLQTSELKLPDEAVHSLERILEIRPDDQAVLHRILDVFTEGKRWRDATNVLARLAEHQSSDELKAKYLYAGALILRDNLGDRDLGTEWMKKVIAADPLHQKAFDAYLEQLQKDRAWSDISKTIRTHLRALPKKTPPARLATLFGRLGEAHEKMRDMKTALAAYDQSAKLSAKAGDDVDVQNERRTQIMKLAISLGDDELDKAVNHGHAMIASNPMELEVYHRLIEIYLKQDDKDRAVAVARTLLFLKQADEAEEELVAKAGGTSQVRSAIKREFWRRSVFHATQDLRLSDVLALVWPMVAAREGRTHAHRNVARTDRVDVTIQSPTAVARYVAHGCQMLDVSVPDLFLKEGKAGGISVDALAEGSGANRTVFPSLLAGKAALGDTDETSLKFRAGRAVARVRPEHILANVLESSASIRNAVYGALHAARPDVPLPDDVVSAAKAHAEQIQAYIQPSRLEQLQALSESIIQSDEVDAKGWLRGVVFTTTRAGFVLCDSIDTAAAMLTREGDEGSSVSAKDRIADLVAYSVSQPYLKLRKQVGLDRK